MAKSLIPKSKAKTAYGLLSEIRKLILEEPRRYNQDQWIAVRGEVPPDEMPACGTVACVGGWVYTLKPPKRRRDGHEHAMKVLGLSWDESWELFGWDKAGDRENLKAHARRGAAHITRFQKKYATQLKAKKV